MTEKMDDFHRILENELAEFLASSKNFGLRIMETLAGLIHKAFELENEFIREGIRCPEPANEEELRHRAQKILDSLQAIQEFREHNRQEEFSNHLATIAESVWALNWITLRNTPVQFIKDMRDAGDYYGNRVLTAHRGNVQHATWINKWTAVLVGLEEYVRQHHRTGFSWNTFVPSGRGSQGVAEHHPPPPPPPPIFDILSQGDAGGFPPRGAIHVDPEVQADWQQMLIQINQGDDIRRMLRPVNRDIAQAAPGAPHAAQHAPARVAQRASVPSHPPFFGLEGRKWRVEYQKSNGNLLLNPGDKAESLAMFKCERSTLKTEAKMNAVTIDNCKRCVVILQHIISSVELIRCEHVEVRCIGTCPNVTIDNCDCVQVFLSDSSAECEVITSKSTSTNICRLVDDGDYVEYPVPEQIKSVLVNGNLQSAVVEHCM